MAKDFYKTGLASIGLSNYKGAKFDNNEKLCDTSGYIPLRIRLKKLDMSAAAAKLARSQFDYHEYEELYDNDITFDRFDDIEEIQNKLDLFNERKHDILVKKRDAYFAAHPDEAAALAERRKMQYENYLKNQAAAQQQSTIQKNQSDETISDTTV